MFDSIFALFRELNRKSLDTINSTVYFKIFLVCICLPKYSYEGIFERRLLNDLLANYQVLERPVANESEPIIVSFGLTLQQIIDVDEKNQVLTSNVWLNLEWVDTNLRWNASEYGGIQDLRITPGKIWKPDILMYNSADEKFDSTYKTNVVVKNNGSCTYIPPGIFKSTCKIDITWFPFDDQRCEMKFGSWTYDGFALDLRLPEEKGDISSYIPNGEWVLVAIPAVHNLIHYDCCPAPYVDITFTIHMRRRTLYYGFNLLIPCIILSSMTLLGFSLPPDSGEKLQLGVTILLSMTVFLVQLSKILPATSESISIIAVYFGCIMIMVAFSVVMTVVVLNFHHRTIPTHEMNYMIKAIMLKWLPWILRMDRYGIKPPERRFTASVAKNRPLSTLNQTNYLGKKGIETNSDQFDTITNGNSFDDELNMNEIDDPINNVNNDFYTNSHINAFTNQCFNQRKNQCDDQCCGCSDQLCVEYSANNRNHKEFNFQHNKMVAILWEMKFLTNRMRKEEERREIIAEWKFAATVIDRLCLILFTLFTVISTAVCILSAPQLIV